MAEEISIYVALLDPINGTDPPLIETMDYINNGIPFKTLDILYTNFRILFPPETLAILTVNIQLGSSVMALTDTKYELLIISNPNNNAKVTIDGKIGKSIQIGSVKFNINLDISVPFDPYISGNNDVPVIVSSDFFDVEGGIFNIFCDNIKDLSMTRDIIVSESYLSISQIDVLNSRVHLNIPYSSVFVINFYMSILSPGSIILNQLSHYILLDSRYIEPIQGTLTITSKSALDYNESPQISENPGKVGAPCDDFLDFICEIYEEVPISRAQAIFKLVITGILSLGGAPSKIKDEWEVYKKINCNSGSSVSSPPAVSIVDSFLNKRSTRVFTSATGIIINLSQSQNFPTFSGPGTIQNLQEVKLTLTNTKSIILGLNLVNLDPYNDDLSLDTSEYNLIQDNDSYNNSGSIFRRAHLITSDYTLTQFDGEVFLIDASKGNIIITIPIGDVSKNRLMEFKRIDSTSNNVIITSPGGIDSYKIFRLNTKICKDKSKSKKLAYIRLFGDGNKLFIFE